MTQRRTKYALGGLAMLALLVIVALKFLQPAISTPLGEPPCEDILDCIAVNTTGSGRVTSSGECNASQDYTIQYGTGQYGTGTVFLCSGTVTLTAIPSRGWVFTGWSDARRWAPVGCSGTDPCTVRMQLGDDYFATATFQRAPHQPPVPTTVSGPSSTGSTRGMSVAIVSVKPTTVTAKHAIVTFQLRVKGMAVSRGWPSANVRGHGHIQVYVDRIPGDAYVRKDLTQHWLASLAATTVGLNLSPALLGGRGKHRIIVALAQNDYVLYHVPAASTTITAQ